jgi:hypothetical protein
MRQILRNNDEIRMTKPRKDTVIAGVSRCLYAAKLEGMTNDQLPGNCEIAFLSLGLRAFFVIRHSCFVISLS